MELVLTIVGVVMLIVGAELMLRGAVDLALRARISPLVVGLTIVSFATSLPELLVSLLAAMKGSSAIAIGNVVGSNIANISLILGVCVVVFPIAVEREARRVHWPVMMGGTVLFMLLLADDLFSRWEGIFFTAALLTYVVLLVRGSRRENRSSDREPPVPERALWLSIALLIVGVAGLSFGSDWFVDGAVGLSRSIGVSEQLIGVTVVAMGTSMPELIASLVAAFRKQPDISLGNLIGSNIFNILGIIGISSAIHPIEISYGSFLPDLLAMLGISLVLYPIMRFGNKVGRWHGALLLALYFGYMLYVILRG